MKTRTICLIAAAAVTVTGTLGVRTEGQVISPEKKIIMVGPGMPTARSLRSDWQEMERRAPFDGVAIYPATYKGGMATGALGRIFSLDRHRIEDFEDGIADLQALRAMKPSRFKHNFLHTYITTGNKDKVHPDWFDNFDTVINNWKVAAEYCKRSGLTGISFDDETYYGPPLWSYKDLKYIGTKTPRQYADQAFLRGSQIMRAINRVYPDIHILCQHGPSTAYEAINRKSGRLVLDYSRDYGLMCAFFDGLLSECTGKARIIDANLASYGWRYGISYSTARKLMKETMGKVSRVPEKYAKHYQAAFQIAMGPFGTIGFDENVNTNCYTPYEFEYALHQALKYADEYVMVDNAQDYVVHWWKAPKGIVLIPQAYGDALLAARHPHPNRPILRNLDAHATTLPGSRSPPRKTGYFPMSRWSGFLAYDEEETFGDLWRNYRELAELPHLWRFRIDPENIGLQEKWFLPTPPDHGWFSITSELPWDDQGYRLYDGYGWYRQDFDAPRLPQGKKIYLAFGAVAHGAEVYVNGQLVGRHHMDGWAYSVGHPWKKRFLIDVTDKLRGGQKNAITVRVVDYGTYAGGIWKPVKLIAKKIRS